MQNVRCHRQKLFPLAESKSMLMISAEKSCRCQAGQPEEPMKDIVAALQRQPFGARLARHIQQRIMGGDPPLTRSEVLELDRECVVLFDWVTNLLAPLMEVSQKANIAMLGTDSGELRAERESASEAVAQQEKKVAQLRRKLRESIRSEQAAADFAAEHHPVKSTQNSSKEASEPSKTKCSEPLEVTGEKSLQYRLEEVAVPTMQEAILQSLVKTMTGPSGTHSCLEVVGHCEDTAAIYSPHTRLNYGDDDLRKCFVWFLIFRFSFTLRTVNLMVSPKSVQKQQSHGF